MFEVDRLALGLDAGCLAEAPSQPRDRQLVRAGKVHEPVLADLVVPEQLAYGGGEAKLLVQLLTTGS
jgi:hypothetical protein